MTPQNERMLRVARQYCDLIEGAMENGPLNEWLENVAALLPRINAAVVQLSQEDVSPDFGLLPDMDRRFELFSRLRELLGELDGYWLEFDQQGDEACRSGSLADDLTDIYCELKSGLELLGMIDGQAGVQQAAANWREGFLEHWGRHLLDAQRHLFDLRMFGQNPAA